MNRRTLTIVLVIVVAIAGGVAFLVYGSADKSIDNMREEKIESKKPDNSPVVNKSSKNSPGQYIDYSSTAIAETKGIKLIFFHAPWCPQCRALEADIKEKGVPPGVTIIKTDYDSNQTLRQRYGVTLQTTIVRVDDSGKLIEKFVAYDNPSLEAIKENLL